MQSPSEPCQSAAPTVVELALEGLHQEREACVRRLGMMLAQGGNEAEVQGYLRRIENINQALIRLAGSHIVH